MSSPTETSSGYAPCSTETLLTILDGIGPTQDGPYHCTNRIHQAGKQTLLQHTKNRAVGGHAHVQKHVLQKKDASTGQTGDVPAEDVQNDSEYLCEVAIGTPAQTLNLDFDTGSADLWVWSTELSSSVRTQGQSAGHTIFDPSKSSTFKSQSGSTWQIAYGDNSTASGDVGTDNVNVGGLTIKNQAVELAKQLSAQFVSGAGDGLLGLAWGSINTVQPTPAATPVENMISQDDIPKNMELFTAYLSNATNTSDSPFYTFGFIDQDVLSAANTSESDIKYTPVDNSQGFWMFDSASISINGSTTQRSGNTAIADTGTTLALIDDTTLSAIYKQIPGAKYDSTQQGWVFPSSTSASDLPTVEFAVGDNLYAVHKQDLAFADAGNGMVYGGIQSRGDLGFDILGDTFLKGIYAIFDQGNQQFGAVQRADPSQGATSTSSST